MKNANTTMEKFSLRPDLQLRCVGKHYMVVDANRKAINFADVFTLNESAVILWRSLEEKPLTKEEMVEILAKTYGKQPSEVATDVGNQISQWMDYGLIVSK